MDLCIIFFPCWLGYKIREVAFLTYSYKHEHKCNYTQMRNPNKSEKWLVCLVINISFINIYSIGD